MVNEQVKLSGEFVVECVGPDGAVKWTERFPNQVTTVGATEILDKAFRGIGYTATWFMGLVTGPGAGNTYAAGDTMATHAGWTELTDYAEANRPAVSFAAASAGSIATSAASQFSMNASVTIAGAFVVNQSTKGGTTGVLYSAKNFTGGDRAVLSGDVVNVAYTTTITV